MQLRIKSSRQCNELSKNATLYTCTTCRIGQGGVKYSRFLRACTSAGLDTASWLRCQAPHGLRARLFGHRLRCFAIGQLGYPSFHLFLYLSAMGTCDTSPW